MNGKHDLCKMTKPFTITTISACNKRIFIVIYHFQYIQSWIFWSTNSSTRSTHKEKWKLWGSNSFEWFDDDLLLALADFYSHIRKIVKKADEPKLNSTGILVVRCLYLFVYLGIFDAVPDHMPVEQVSLKLVTVSVRVKYPYEMVLQVCLKLLWHHF